MFHIQQEGFIENIPHLDEVFKNWLDLNWIELFYIKVGNAKMPIDEKDKNQVRTKTL
jgi:hypothetical protein